MVRASDSRSLLGVALGRLSPRELPGGADQANARLLSREGLGGLALRAWPESSGQWSPEAYELLRRERADLAALEALREQAVRVLAAALDDAPILLKGFAYGRSLYEAPEDRPCGDVDVLLPPGAFDVAALESAGFRPLVLPGPPRPLPKGGWNTRTFKRGPVSLDLHVRVFRDPPYRFPTPVLRRRARAMVEAGGVEKGAGGWLELDRLDAICFHVAHLGKHCFRGPLVRWVDLSRMLERWIAPEGKAAWKALRERAEETRTMRVTRLAFATLDELALRRPTIPDVASKLRPRVMDRWLARRILNPQALHPHRPTLSLQALFRVALADEPVDAMASLPVAMDWLRRKAVRRW